MLPAEGFMANHRGRSVGRHCGGGLYHKARGRTTARSRPQAVLAPMLRSLAVTFPKLVVHAALAGFYGGLVVVRFVGLANPADAPDGIGRWLTALLVVAAYTLAAAIVWPVLYAALRFFASHRLRLSWLSLRYLIGFHVANTAVLLVAGWIMLSEFRSALGKASP